MKRMMVLIVVLTASLVRGAMAAPLDWEQICETGFGNLKNYSAFSAVEYEGTLYVGNHNLTEGCEIWRFDSPSTSDWTKVSLNGFGNSQNDIPYSMAVYQDKIYVGARNNGANGFEIWSYNGVDWSFVTNALGLGDADLKIPASMLVLDGKLILGAGNSWTDNKAKVYEFDGTNWAQINTDSFGDSNNRQCRSLCEYGGDLYAGTYNNSEGGQVWRYDGPTPSDWTAAATNGFGVGMNNTDTRSLCAYDGKLYAGTANTLDGCQIWETSNGLDWARNDPGTNLYFDATRTMVAYGTNLFVGTGNALGDGGKAPGAQVWRYTGGTNWNQINENGFGFIAPGASTPTSMAIHFLLMKDGYLYAGLSDAWNSGSSVWRTWIGILPSHPPVASNDVASIQEDTAVVINVLANDTDGDGDFLTVSNVTQGANGMVVINGGGTNVTYTPANDWSGADSFTYTVSDGNGMSDTGTVDVTVSAVNDPPVAGDDTGMTLEDTALVINVLTNDTDIDNGILAISHVTQAENGSVAIMGGSANVTYAPNADWNGADSFIYTVGDWYGGFSTGTVVVIVTPVNDAPRVTLVTPVNGDVLWVGCSMDLTASPSDVDGTVTQVVFLADGIEIGQATEVPWSTTSTLINTGQYDIIAIARDDLSTIGTSATAVVTVPFDYDSDNMADTWEYKYDFSPTNAADALNDDDGDTFINGDEYIADTDPLDSNDYFRVISISNFPDITIYFESSENCIYTMDGCSNLIRGIWTNVPGTGPRMGIGGLDSMTDTNQRPKGSFYRLEVARP